MSRFQAFIDLLGSFYSLASKIYDWFRTISIYICINYLNNFLVDGKVGLKAEADPKSRLKKPEVAELSILGISLPWAVAPLSCVIVLLGAESLSNLLRIAKLHRGFFQ